MEKYEGGDVYRPRPQLQPEDKQMRAEQNRFTDKNYLVRNATVWVDDSFGDSFPNELEASQLRSYAQEIAQKGKHAPYAVRQEFNRLSEKYGFGHPENKDCTL